MKMPFVAAGLAIGVVMAPNAGGAGPRGAMAAGGSVGSFVVAQAMVPPTGMDDAQNPMPMEERMNRRFPQPVRVGDLIGLPVLDENSSTIGFVRRVVRAPDGKINLIVSYSRWFGWFGWDSRPVAVPVDVVGIEGRQIVSLDMPRSEYDTSPTWQATDAAVLPDDATIRIPLGRS